MRIAVCDDEAEYCNQIQTMIEKIYHSLDLIVDTYQTGQDLLRWFPERKYDLIFLDIEMPGIDGISLARRLRERKEELRLVFLTSHVEYALKGYEVQALRYLTKPVQEDKLEEVLSYVMKQMQGQRIIWLKTNGGEERVSVSDILYLEAQDQNILILTAEQSYTVRYNLRDFERELREYGFFRIHRGYLVSLGKISAVRKNEVTLDGGTVLPLSRTKEKPLKEALYQYIKKEAL